MLFSNIFGTNASVLDEKNNKRFDLTLTSERFVIKTYTVDMDVPSSTDGEPIRMTVDPDYNYKRQFFENISHDETCRWKDYNLLTVHLENLTGITHVRDFISNNKTGLSSHDKTRFLNHLAQIEQKVEAQQAAQVDGKVSSVPTLTGGK
jgi:hypothetical protein